MPLSGRQRGADAALLLLCCSKSRQASTLDKGGAPCAPRTAVRTDWHSGSSFAAHPSHRLRFVTNAPLGIQQADVAAVACRTEKQAPYHHIGMHILKRSALQSWQQDK